MTPLERAEKILNEEFQVKSFQEQEKQAILRIWTPILVKAIAEAEKEAYEKGFKDLQEHRMESTKQAHDRGWNSAIEQAAKIATHYWDHIPPEAFEDGFEIPKKEYPDFVHTDIAKQIRALRKESK